MNYAPTLRIARNLFVILLATLASGCLSVARKEIIYKVRPDGSGTARIVFHNIVSVDQGDGDTSVRDYTELVSTYVKGKKFEEYYPLFTNFRKRLYEEDGVLNGEITYDFVSYEDVGLYRYMGKGPWMYHIGYHSGVAVEHFDTSNGTIGSETMPVIFWPDSTKEFHVSSSFEHNDAGDVHTLLPLFKRIGTD